MHLGVIGIGSNSVRLLVADAQGERLHSTLRDRRGTRLFASLSASGLSEEGMRATCACVQEMMAEARNAGAEQVYGFATSAVRDAGNREVFLELLRREAGLVVEVISGEEEAVLSYYGAAQDGLCGMIDIGGGSTEITIGRDGVPLCAVSSQMGAVRLHGRIPIEKAGDVARVEAEARLILRRSRPEIDAAPSPAQWVGVGGTFTTLAAMEKQLFSFDRKLVQGHELDYETARAWAERVAEMPLAERYELPGLQPQRADIVVHGIAILMGCMRELGIEKIIVSDKGNLEGYLKRRLRTQDMAQFA